jgi:hypothetical protein
MLQKQRARWQACLEVTKLTLSSYHDSSEETTPLAATNPVSTAIARRGTKRAAIEAFFASHIGQQFSSPMLHAQYGSAFRSRVSDINRDPAASVTISNAVSVKADGAEESVYSAEVRQ